MKREKENWSSEFWKSDIENEWWVILRKTEKSDQIWKNQKQWSLNNNLKIESKDAVRFVMSNWWAKWEHNSLLCQISDELNHWNETEQSEK